MMLGFREIGQIGDGIERIAENVNKGVIENSDEINNIIRLLLGFTLAAVSMQKSVFFIRKQVCAISIFRR